MPDRVLVLGGSSDIAAAIVESLEPRPSTVVLAGRNEPPLVDFGIWREWDALDIAGHASSLGEMFTDHGPFDLVICAVGLLGHHAGRTMGPVEVDQMVRTNFAGPAAALAVVAELMSEHPRGSREATIVVLSSIAAVRPRRSNYVYGSSKAGLDAFAQGLGDALNGSGVRVVVVRPGFVRSKMTVGLDPAPFAVDPKRVGRSVATALGRGRVDVVWVPPLLGALMRVLTNVPRSIWRRIAGDR